jgi:preprotein translocase subunit SecE
LVILVLAAPLGFTSQQATPIQCALGLSGWLLLCSLSAESGSSAQRSVVILGVKSKVVWPARKEAMQMTAYVFAFRVVMVFFVVNRQNTRVGFMTVLDGKRNDRSDQL